MKAICSSASHASDHSQTSRFLLPPGPSPLPALPPSPARSRSFVSLLADSPSAPVNVTVKHLKANSAVVTWDVLEDEVVIGFAISQQVRCSQFHGFGHVHLHPSSPRFPNSLAAV